MKKVYLVGAGPGDPELITLKGLSLIKKADVIIYDRLAGKEILRGAKKGAELIYVGKGRGAHTFRQEEINRLLVEKAAHNKLVVRLKGGDPLVFGRGGEEIRVLKARGIAWEVVPGITSAIAVPELAGIPLTDRKYASSFTVVTGQEDPTKQERKIDYGALKADTVVILMGIANLDKIVKQMLRTRSESTPAAIIHDGTTKKQRVVTGTLGTILAKAKKEKVKAPAVIVVGEVIRLRKEFK